MKIAFIPDGGPRTGLGHLGRCIAIAQSIRQVSGKEAVFISNDAGSRAWIRERGFSTRPTFHGRWDLVVMDSYLKTRDEINRIRTGAGVFVVIDDRGRVPPRVDWVINTTVNAHEGSYSKASPKGLLLGPKYHPLRKEFLSGKRPLRTPSTVRSVLVSLGGTDQGGLLANVIDEIGPILSGGSIHVVLGPYSTTPPVKREGNVVYHRSPKRISGLLSRADLAISAAGQTLFELAFMGIPTLAVEIAPNQHENIKGFAGAGVVRSLGRARDPELRQRLRASFRDLTLNPRKRRSMALAGRQLVDGLGGRRLAKVLVR